MENSNEHMDVFKKKLVNKIIFSDLSDRNVSMIRVRAGSFTARLSEDYLERNELRRVRKISLNSTILHLLVFIAFVAVNLSTGDALVQLGLIVVSLAIVLVSAGMCMSFCEKTIKDGDIILEE